MKKNFILFTLLCSFFCLSQVANAQNWTLEMHDSFGDGWNGASIGVSINGGPVTNYTMAGFSATANLGVIPAGQSIVITRIALGSFPTEVSWILRAPNNLIKDWVRENQYGQTGVNPIPVFSTWTVSNLTSTAADQVTEGCEFGITLADSFGDGWNGGYLTVTVGGSLYYATIVNGSTAAGTAGNYDFFVPFGGTSVVIARPFAGNAFIGEMGWTLTEPAGNAFCTATCIEPTGGGAPSGTLYNATVACAAPEPCIITCPGDILISLGPGECSATIFYNISEVGECGVPVPQPFTGFTPAEIWSFVNVPGGTGGSFNGAGLPDQLTVIGGNVFVAGYSAYVADFPFGGSISFDWAYTTADAAFWDQVGYVRNGIWTDLSNPNGANVQNGSFAIALAPGDDFGVGVQTVDGGFGAATGVFTNVAGVNVGLSPTVVTGPASGSELEPGVYTVTACNTDGISQQQVCCSFDISIFEFTGATTTLACNDNIQVSVDTNCQAFIATDMILEGGPYNCYDDYLVEVEGYDPALGGVLIGSEAVGETLTVTVTDPATGNSCWGTISVEDKLPPVIICTDATLNCGESIEPVFTPPILGAFATNTVTVNLPLGPDAGTLTTSTLNLNVPNGAIITDVNFILNLTHTFTADMSFTLTSPGGSTAFLQQTGCGGNFPFNFILDDEGVILNACTDFNQPGVHITPPGNFWPLNTLDGAAAGGTWTLEALDNFNLDGGTLIAWGVEVTYDVVLPYAPVATDNCGDVTLSYEDVVSGDDCEEQLITRTWTATDESGNTATCNQLLTILPLVIDAVTCPEPYVGSCGDDIHPDNTGWPTVNGSEITDEQNVCNIFVGYWDKELNDCGEGTKIVRTWTVLDWCTQQTVECVQVIKLSDDEAPELDCPEDFTVGTDFWYCNANVSVPKPGVFDECGSSYTLSLSSEAGIIVSFGNNYVINQLPIGDHVITWTATDECGNVSTCTFVITVEDDVVPVALCDLHTIVALTNDGPFGVTLVPASVFDDGSYDACGPVTFRARRMESCIDFDWTTQGACIDHIPNGGLADSRDKGTVHRPCVPFACCDVGAGPIMVELEVTDASGNVNYCMVEIEVQDKIAPFVECPPDIIVSCDFWFAVEEGTFIDDDTDPNSSGYGNLDEDVLSPVFGNMWDAFKFNDDESVRQDIIINDPGNFTINQPHFWGIDGWADDNCEVNLQVRVRVIDDCSGDDLPANAPPGAVKLIERRFSANDGNSEGSGNCTQRIWVVDFEPFFITDVTCFNANPNDGVIWPCDVLLTTCPEDLGDTGEPEILDDACSVVGIAYEDTRFDFVDGACFKILRRWAVIDWCQYDPLTGAGLWYYTQVIKVHDEDGPEFVECPVGPVVLCVADDGVSLPDNNQAFLGEDNPLASSCSAHLNLCQIVHETCSDFISYDVKIYPFNGDEFIQIKPTTSVAVDTNNNAELCFDTRQSTIQAIRLNGIPYNSPWCGDYHRILWSVQDGCGNWSHCEYLFRLEDCKQPSPVCINGLSTVVMPQGGQVTVWAKDFDASSFDDCTPADELLFSFSGDTYQPSFTYTCDNVPAFGVELSVNIWVADFGTDDNCNGQISWNERNKDFCTTTIVITDNANVCGDTSGNILAGEVLTEDIQSVEKVGITLVSPGHVFPTYVTVEDGIYNFNNVILPSSFTINAERNDAHKNGVSTLDLVKIQKHLLGIEAISSPYDLIAADANNSQGVSAVDLIELRKLILGIYTELPNNKSWRFVDESFQFADPTSPWPFEESISATNAGGNMFNQDFVAIKVGDVNNTVQANALQILPRNGNSIVNFVAEERNVTAGEIVDVAISSADFAGIEGYQFTLQTAGLEFKGVSGGAVDMTSEENLGVFGSTITASWHKIGGVTTGANDVLFTLHFQATAAGQLSEMINLNSRETEAEAYNTSADIKDLKLTFRGSESGAEFALYQNEPNPFKGETVIGYDLPAAGKVTLTVFDVTGKVVMVKDQDAVKGYNTIAVSSKEIPSVGVLYYRLDANEYTATKKMIIIE